MLNRHYTQAIPAPLPDERRLVTTFSTLTILIALIIVICGLSAFSYADTAYISNEKGNTVSVLDLSTMKITDTFPVGQRPRGIALSNNGRHLYVCASDDDIVEVYDTTTHKRLYTLPSGPDPELMVLHPTGNPLYIANEDDNLVSVVDVLKRSIIAEIPVGVEPEGLGISPDGRVLVNTSETTNMAHFIDTTTYGIFANVLVDSRPRVAVFTRDNQQLWVSSEIGGSVTVINPENQSIIKIIEFAIPGVPSEAIQPVGVRITDDGSTVFVALGPANRIAIIDGHSLEVIDYLLVGQRVWQLALSPNERFLISTNGNSNDISVIDVAERTVIKSIQVGLQPWGVAIANH